MAAGGHLIHPVLRPLPLLRQHDKVPARRTHTRTHTHTHSGELYEGERMDGPRWAARHPAGSVGQALSGRLCWAGSVEQARGIASRQGVAAGRRGRFFDLFLRPIGNLYAMYTKVVCGPTCGGIAEQLSLVWRRQR